MGASSSFLVPHPHAQTIETWDHWDPMSTEAGLCGGSYYKREAILDALSDERVSQLDWTPDRGTDGVKEWGAFKLVWCNGC